MSHIKPAFGCGHHEGFMSSHKVTKLLFKGPSNEPHSKLNFPFSSGIEGSTTRSLKMIPSLGCSTINMPISFTFSSLKSRTMTCSTSKYEFLSSSSPKWLWSFRLCPTRTEAISVYPMSRSPMDLWFSKLVHDSFSVPYWSISSPPPVSHGSLYHWIPWSVSVASCPGITLTESSRKSAHDQLPLAGWLLYILLTQEWGAIHNNSHKTKSIFTFSPRYRRVFSADQYWEDLHQFQLLFL